MSHPDARRSPARRPLAPLALFIVALLTAGSWVWMSWDGAPASVVVGVPEATSTSTTGPTVPPAPPSTEPPAPTGAPIGAQPEPAPAPGLAHPDGQPWPPPIAFASATPVPDQLTFVLVVGSDARPGRDPLRGRADSIHLVAANPATGQGTIVGFPRDAWVDIPGRGRGKINSALPTGGPDLLAQTVGQLTGLPVHYYVVTGFEGFTRLVDDLGGLDAEVTRRMDDHFSGARFEPGWHRFDGHEALAFARNRKDTERGDFSRSEHHGRLMLAALAKMRAEVADDHGVHAWLDVLLRHVRLDVPLSELPRLGALGRSIDPSGVTNVVVPGTVGRAGGQSVVFLDPGITGLFDDLRDDAVVGAAAPPPAPAPAPAPAGDPPPG